MARTARHEPSHRTEAQKRRFVMLQEEAVSDVLGAVLLVGITVVMAAAFGVLLLSYDGPSDTQHTQLAITIGPGSDQDWGPNDAELRIKHIGGEPLRQADVTIQYTEAGGSPQTVQPTFAGGKLSIGQSWTRTISAFPGDAVSVLVVVDLGSTGQVVASSLVPAGGTSTVVLTYAASAAATLGTVTDFARAQDANDGGLAAQLSEGSVGATPTTTTLASSGTGNSGAVNPNNVQVSDNQYAVLDNTGDYVQAQSYTLAGNPFAITNLVMGVEAKGTQGFQTVALAGTTTGSAGQAGTSSPVQNLASVASASITPNAAHVYTAVVAHGDSLNPAQTVSTVSGLGLSWTRVATAVTSTGSSARGHMELWVSSGSPTMSGPVTATFSGLVEDAIIWVSAWSGVDASNPIQASNTAVSGGATAFSVGAIAGTASNGRFVTAVNAVSAATVVFTNPLTEDQPEVDKDEVHLALAHGPAAASNAASGVVGVSVRWQAISWTLRPAPVPLPAILVTYHLSPSGPAGTTSFSPPLSTTDGIYTIPIIGDRAWTKQDVQGMAVRVTIPTGSLPSTIEIDDIFLTITTTNGPSTFSLDAQLDWPTPAQLPPTGTHYLQIRYATSNVDSYTVEVRSGTGPFTWRLCATLLTSGPTQYDLASCLLTAAETASGSPVIRIRDVNTLGTVQGTLHIDYARVASS